MAGLLGGMDTILQRQLVLKKSDRNVPSAFQMFRVTYCCHAAMVNQSMSTTRIINEVVTFVRRFQRVGWTGALAVLIIRAD